MHLTKLEILGFKSFANRTIIKFTRDITGVVGPNGCGKTNIVDAIRWALGEQKSSTLRSDKMENVIFNGTKERKPMGMSEVSLTLVNDKGILPSEYSEITITRRIFRSGESEYLLNKNVCRLKDITNLFMDTGMGTNAYSVIELKMIETILNSKADERRKMFEEAAGVNKYKLRRRLSLKKLEDVKTDLRRVNDILAEVEKNVRSLERQAKKSERYNQFQSVLKEKEIDLCEREFAQFTSDEIKWNEKERELIKKKDEIDSDIRELERKLIELRDELNSKEFKLRNKQAEINEKSEQLFGIQNSISVAEERLKSFESNTERSRREINEYNIQIEESEHLIERNNERIEELNEIIAQSETDLSSIVESVSEKRLDVDSKKERLKEENDKSIEQYKKINFLDSELNAARERGKSISDKIENANQNILNITNKLAKTVGYLEELSSEKSEAETRLEESEGLFTSKQKEKEELEKDLSKLKNDELEAKSLLNGLNDRIEFIQSLITNLEGVSKGSKVLLEDRSWSKNQHALFADAGTTKEEYKYALEIALQSVLNNLLIEELDELKKAVNYLKENDLGKASFIIVNNLERKKSFTEAINNFAYKRKRKRIKKEDGFIEWALSLIDTDPKWLPYFEAVLRNTAVVENLDAALTLYKRYPGFNFTTIEGDIIQSGGIINAGSLPKIDDTLFGRKKFLDDLKARLPEHKNKLEQIQSEITDKEETLSKIDLRILSEQGKLIYNDLTNIEKQISQFEFEREKADEEIEKIRSEIQNLISQSDAVEAKLADTGAILEEAKLKGEETSAKIKFLENELHDAEDILNELVESENELKLKLERQRGELKNLYAAVDRSRELKDSISSAIEKKQADISNYSNEISIINENLISDSEMQNSLSSEKEILLSEGKEIEAELDELKRISGGYETDLNNIRNERQTYSDNLHDVDIKLNELKIRLERLVDQVNENYSTTLTLKEFDDLDSFNFEERRIEVQDLKTRIKNLGPINLLAYSEFEEEKERFDFLNKQRNDLIDSEKDLVSTINEINESAQDLFIDTFEKIRGYFKLNFQTLFNPGDEADLILEEGVDPLEAKIEIIAKPKGKRPMTIEALSQGEKTLTATALLFGIYQVKPSPFCIMDEVDAPLDDANIERFTKLLNEFKENTQFIIVTHNKRTMTATKNMYGVTMQEDGVSKLVGVQFNEELAIMN